MSGRMLTTRPDLGTWMEIRLLLIIEFFSEVVITHVYFTNIDSLKRRPETSDPLCQGIGYMSSKAYRWDAYKIYLFSAA